MGKKLWAKKDKYNSILVVDLHMIGDIVMLIPLLKELKNKYPESNLSLLSGSWAPVVLKELNIDNFFILDAPWVKSNTISSWLNLFRTIVKLRKFKWELTIDVRGDLRNSLIKILSPLPCEKKFSELNPFGWFNNKKSQSFDWDFLLVCCERWL